MRAISDDIPDALAEFDGHRGTNFLSGSFGAGAKLGRSPQFFKLSANTFDLQPASIIV